jgi:hypothetical protein
VKATDERFTPESVLAVVREFDDIVLDPCTTSDNPTKAAVFLTRQRSGLAECWSGVIADSGGAGVTFWNPPYSRGQVLRWAEKAVTEWERNSVESIGLVIADTSTRATQWLLARANAGAFWNKRIRFVGADGAKFANALFYLGERQGRFRRVFEQHATVLVLR